MTNSGPNVTAPSRNAMQRCVSGASKTKPGAGPSVLALQFHVEAEPQRLERWLIGHTGEIARAGLDVRALRAEIAQQGPAVAAAGAQAFIRWLDGIDPA